MTPALFGRLGLSFVVLTGLASCAEPGGRAIRTVRVYELLAAFPRAKVDAPDTAYVALRPSTLGGEHRPAVFAHATASIEFPPIEITEHSVLTAFIGLDDSVEHREGDGVEFIVTVKLNDDVAVNVFRRVIDPRVRVDDRGWVAIRVPLGSFAGQVVRVVLGTGPGSAGNNSYDWAFWGEPRVFLDAL